MFFLLINIPLSSPPSDNTSVTARRSTSTQIKSPAGSSSGEGDSRGATINKDKDNATVSLWACPFWHLINSSSVSLQNRSVSMVDMYIDNSEPSENVGQIHFSLEYDFQNTTLILKVIQVSKYAIAINFRRLPSAPQLSYLSGQSKLFHYLKQMFRFFRTISPNPKFKLKLFLLQLVLYSPFDLSKLYLRICAIVSSFSLHRRMSLQLLLCTKSPKLKLCTI